MQKKLFWTRFSQAAQGQWFSIGFPDHRSSFLVFWTQAITFL
jgi:hypothetical protein